MITSMFASLNRASRGMQHAQFAITLHSSNIANANNPTHTRRDPLPDTGGVMLNGGVARLRDLFLDEQYRNAAAALGEADARRNILTRVEDVFGDPVNGGLRKAIDRFFDSWTGLGELPGDEVARMQVLSAGKEFVHQVKSTYQQLQSVETRINEQLTHDVSEVNRYIDTVSELNGKIAALKQANQPHADLEDKLDAAVDELAKLVGATFSKQPDGTMRVIVGNIPVVDGLNRIKLQMTDAAGGFVPKWEGFPDVPFTAGGSIKGLIGVRDGQLNLLKTEIDDMAKAIATAVNDVHKTGVDLNGDPGVDFFHIGAGPVDIAVNPTLTEDMIAAASPASVLPDGTVEQSDGTIAKELAKLGEEPLLESIVIPGKMQSAREYYRNLTGWIGTQAQETQYLEDLAKSRHRVSEQQRQSVWGVSVDEEVANMTMQQKAFMAAARVFNVMDEMLDQLINGTGR